MRKKIFLCGLLVFTPVANAEFCVNAGVISLCTGTTYDNYRIPRFDVGFVVAQYQAALAYLDYIKTTINIPPELVNNTETGFMLLDDLVAAGESYGSPPAIIGAGYFYGPINDIRTSGTFNIEWNPGHYVQQIPYLLDQYGNQIAANPNGSYTLPTGTHNLTARQGFFNYATYQFDWYETPVTITVDPTALLYWLIDTQQTDPITAPDQNGDCKPNQILIENVSGQHQVCGTATVYTSEPGNAEGHHIMVGANFGASSKKRGVMNHRVRFQAQRGHELDVPAAGVNSNQPITSIECTVAVAGLTAALEAINQLYNYASCIETVLSVIAQSPMGLSAGFQHSYPNQASPIYHCDIEVFSGLACVAGI